MWLTNSIQCRTGARSYACTNGFHKCADDKCYADGDASHCGSSCSNCQANKWCNNGVCQCLPGFADCNGLAGDGCEANIESDNSNCGGCGKVCSSCPAPPPPGPGLPTGIAGLQLWLAADRNLTTCCSGGTCSTNIGSWKDLSGHGYYFTPQDGPVAVPSTSPPYLHFDGQWLGANGVNLHCQDALGNYQVTVFVVASIPAGTIEGPGYGSWADILDYSHYGSHNFVVQNSGNDNMFSTAGGNGQLIPNDGNLHVLTTGFHWDNTEENVFSALDGASRINIHNVPPPPSRTWSEPTALGIANNAYCCPGRVFIGGIAEVIIYNVALQLSDMVTIENYLKVKYGIA